MATDPTLREVSLLAVIRQAMEPRHVYTAPEYGPNPGGQTWVRATPKDVERAVLDWLRGQMDAAQKACIVAVKATQERANTRLAQIDLDVPTSTWGPIAEVDVDFLVSDVLDALLTSLGVTGEHQTPPVEGGGNG
jgi:hypothetical protein